MSAVDRTERIRALSLALELEAAGLREDYEHAKAETARLHEALVDCEMTSKRVADRMSHAHRPRILAAGEDAGPLRAPRDGLRVVKVGGE